jgi:polyferredoxin
MGSRMKLVRRIVQLLTLGLFVWLFVQTRWLGTGVVAARPWFLRMDPLTALCAVLAPTPTWLPLFVPAIVLLMATVVFGRFFCGWICPMGTTLDVADHLLLRRRRRRPEPNRPSWKYYVLGASLVAALFGTQLAWLMDPIPLLTRTLALVAYPIAVGAYNLGVISGRPVLQATGLSLYPTDQPPAFALNVLVLVVFVVIVGLSALSRRFWCRSLCPLGALLAVAGRFGLWNRRVTGCVSCRRCVGECKMGAIPADGEDFSATLQSECIQCYDCVVCPRDGITSVGLHVPSAPIDPTLQARRRHFLAALGAGLLYGAAASTGAGRKGTHARLIRPPGAILRTSQGIRPMGEDQFRDLCARCGNCMKACVTGGLQPAVAEAGFDGCFTPILVPKLGHCEQSCTACGEVCPTGALGPFSVEEKSKIRIGLAAIDTDRCLSWRHGSHYKLCLVCAEQCSYGAVEVWDDRGQRRPVVNADKCVGCGMCERKCPCKPEAAIVVYRRSNGV